MRKKKFIVVIIALFYLCGCNLHNYTTEVQTIDWKTDKSNPSGNSSDEVQKAAPTIDWGTATLKEAKKYVKNGGVILEKELSWEEKYEREEKINKGLLPLPPLMLAAMKNPHPEIIEFLLKNGLDVNERYYADYRPVVFAVKYSPNVEVVKTLIKNKAGINYYFYRGTIMPYEKSILKYAIYRILKKDYNEHYDDETEPAEKEIWEKMKASKELDTTAVEILSLLFDSGIIIQREEEVESLLELKDNLDGIKDEKSKKILEKVLLKAEDKIKKNNELLKAAAEENNPKIIKKLIKNGADVDYVDKHYYTALMYAAEKNPNPKISEVLLDAGADIDGPFGSDGYLARNGNPPFFAALMNNNLEVIKLFVKRGNIKLRNEEGSYDYAPLTIACSNPEVKVEVIKFLIDNGADINSEQYKGITPLNSAYEAGVSLEVIALLLDNYEYISGDTDPIGYHPLIEAARYNVSPEILELLIKKGTNVNARDEYRRTPLIYAVREKFKPEFIEFLLKHGADINIKNNDGKTALDYALEEDNKEALQVLRKYQNE